MSDFPGRLVRSFRFRILLGYAVVVSLVAVAWAWSLFGPLTSAIVEQQQTHLLSVAQAGAVALSPAGVESSPTVGQLVAGTDLRMTAVAADGRVLADSQQDPTRMENHATRPEVAAALAGQVGRDTRVSRTQGISETYVAVPARLSGQRVALRVSEPLVTIEALAADARRSGLLLLAATIVLSVAATGYLARRAAAPVARLTDSARQMAQGDLSTIVDPEAGELGVLSTALSDLQRQLRSRISALEAERSSLRAVLDGLPESVFLLEDGKIAVANAAASAMFRAPAGGWTGSVIGETPLPASLSSAIMRLAEHGSGTDEIGDAAYQRFLVVVSDLPSAPDVTRRLVAVTDVTERARLDAVRRDFVANASHEFKTPIAGIRLLAESARAAADDGDVEQALAFVSQIDHEAARLHELVRDLLDLTRLEGKGAEGEVTDPRAAIDLAATVHRLGATKKGIELVVDLEPVAGRDLYVAAEATDVAVLLDSLLDNAVKYTEKGRVTLRLEADEESARLSVSDTGVGIPPEALPRIFERFYRVDGARSRERGGSGLGLSLVKHMVEGVGGSVAVTSEVGRGTRVDVVLPLAG